MPKHENLSTGSRFQMSCTTSAHFVPEARRWPLGFSALRRLLQRTPAQPFIGRRRSHLRVCPPRSFSRAHVRVLVCLRVGPGFRPACPAAGRSPHGVPARLCGGRDCWGRDQPTLQCPRRHRSRHSQLGPCQSVMGLLTGPPARAGPGRRDGLDR